MGIPARQSEADRLATEVYWNGVQMDADTRQTIDSAAAELRGYVYWVEDRHGLPHAGPFTYRHNAEFAARIADEAVTVVRHDLPSVKR